MTFSIDPDPTLAEQVKKIRNLHIRGEIWVPARICITRVPKFPNVIDSSYLTSY